MSRQGIDDFFAGHHGDYVALATARKEAADRIYKQLESYIGSTKLAHEFLRLWGLTKADHAAVFTFVLVNLFKSNEAVTLLLLKSLKTQNSEILYKCLLAIKNSHPHYFSNIFPRLFSNFDTAAIDHLVIFYINSAHRASTLAEKKRIYLEFIEQIKPYLTEKQKKALYFYIETSGTHLLMKKEADIRLIPSLFSDTYSQNTNSMKKLRTSFGLPEGAGSEMELDDFNISICAKECGQ